MVRRLVALLLTSGSLVCLAGVVAVPAPLLLRGSVAGLIAIACWRPTEALVLVAAFGPLAGALNALDPYRDGWTVPLILAVTAGYALRRMWRSDPVADLPLAAAATAWFALVLASLITPVPAHPVSHLAACISEWANLRFPLRADRQYQGLWAGAVAIAGVAAYVMTTEECVRRPGLNRRTLRMLLMGAAAVGALNVYRLFEVALRQPPFPETLVEIQRWIRISATFPDLNAAGAFFLLMLPAALLMLRDSRLRTSAAIAMPLLLAGLWLAGSRTALIVLVLTLAGMALAVPGGRWPSWRVLATAFVLTAALVVGRFYLRVPSTGDASIAFGVRREMAIATLRMLREHPWSGVGLGQYRRLSPDYMSPLMKSWYPLQNAHNQFLQVAGELGVPGLLVFTALVSLGVVPAARAAWRTRDCFDVGLAFGVLGFLAASLTMHPLLIPEVAIAFWIMLGLCRAAALRGAAA